MMMHAARGRPSRTSVRMASRPHHPVNLPTLLLLALLLLPSSSQAFVLLPRSSSHRPATPKPAAATLPSPAADPSSLPLFRTFFQGKFDNAEQVAEERAQGMEAGPAGGHEQIHCVLQPLDSLPAGSLGADSQFCLGATYYFDGRPEAVFRCRVYSFHPPPPPPDEDDEEGESFFLPPPPFAEMRLHRFTPEFEGFMRANKYDLSLLPRAPAELAGVLEELEGCSILWSRAEAGSDGEQAAEGFRGTMREGFCLVQSQREAEIQLKIEDDLLLTAHVLSVNDRGTDCQTGQIVYGNYRAVPYRMQRRR